MVISIFTIMASLIVLGFFTIIYLNTNRIVQSFRNRIEMEAFLAEATPEGQYHTIEQNILSIPGVSSVAFISKDSAAKIFKAQFGEDVNAVLDFNPLPASFKIYLDQGYKNSDSAQAVHQKVKAVQGVGEVIYRKTLLELLDRRSQLFVIVSLAAGFLLTIGAIFLVSNTIRLAIYAKRKIIATMKLVGATRMFIRLPFIVEGIIQGLLGGLFSAGVIYGLAYYAAALLGNEFAAIVTVEPIFYPLIVGVGMLLGFFGSAISIRKFISENVS
jgi:cell division transport system permease protein